MHYGLTTFFMLSWFAATYVVSGTRGVTVAGIGLIVGFIISLFIYRRLRRKSSSGRTSLS